MDTKSIQEYLDELRKPSVPLDQEGRINPFEFQSYRATLDNKRVGFILAVSGIDNKQSVDFILQELTQIKNAIKQRGLTTVNENDVLEGIIAGRSEFEPFYQLQIIEKMLLESVEQTLSHFGRIDEPSGPSQEDKSIQKETTFEKELAKYSELLTVKDIMEIYHLTTDRTVRRWEEQGLLINVSEVSNETNSNGHRKRGKKSLFRKDAVLSNIKLNEKFNELVNPGSR